MTSVVIRRFLVLIMTAIATARFQLEQHVDPDIFAYGVARVAFTGLGFVGWRVVLPMVTAERHRDEAIRFLKEPRSARDGMHEVGKATGGRVWAERAAAEAEARFVEDRVSQKIEHIFQDAADKATKVLTSEFGRLSRQLREENRQALGAAASEVVSTEREAAAEAAHESPMRNAEEFQPGQDQHQDKGRDAKNASADFLRGELHAQAERGARELEAVRSSLLQEKEIAVAAAVSAKEAEMKAAEDLRFENRPSRQEDLSRIRLLENAAAERENILAGVREEAASLKQELLNREKENSNNMKFTRKGADTDGTANTDSQSENPASSGGGGGDGGSEIGDSNDEGHGDGAGAAAGSREGAASRQLSTLRKPLDDQVPYTVTSSGIDVDVRDSPRLPAEESSDAVPSQKENPDVADFTPFRASYWRPSSADKNAVTDISEQLNLSLTATEAPTCPIFSAVSFGKARLTSEASIPHDKPCALQGLRDQKVDSFCARDLLGKSTASKTTLLSGVASSSRDPKPPLHGTSSGQDEGAPSLGPSQDGGALLLSPPPATDQGEGRYVLMTTVKTTRSSLDPATSLEVYVAPIKQTATANRVVTPSLRFGQTGGAARLVPSQNGRVLLLIPPPATDQGDGQGILTATVKTPASLDPTSTLEVYVFTIQEAATTNRVVTPRLSPGHDGDALILNPSAATDQGDGQGTTATSDTMDRTSSPIQDGGEGVDSHGLETFDLVLPDSPRQQFDDDKGRAFLQLSPATSTDVADDRDITAPTTSQTPTGDVVVDSFTTTTADVSDTRSPDAVESKPSGQRVALRNNAESDTSAVFIAGAVSDDTSTVERANVPLRQQTSVATADVPSSVTTAGVSADAGSTDAVESKPSGQRVASGNNVESDTSAVFTADAVSDDTSPVESSNVLLWQQTLVAATDVSDSVTTADVFANAGSADVVEPKPPGQHVASGNSEESDAPSVLTADAMADSRPAEERADTHHQLKNSEATADVSDSVTMADVSVTFDSPDAVEFNSSGQRVESENVQPDEHHASVTVLVAMRILTATVSAVLVVAVLSIAKVERSRRRELEPLSEGIQVCPTITVPQTAAPTAMLACQNVISPVRTPSLPPPTRPQTAASAARRYPSPVTPPWVTPHRRLEAPSNLLSAVSTRRRVSPAATPTLANVASPGRASSPPSTQATSPRRRTTPAVPESGRSSPQAIPATAPTPAKSPSPARKMFPQPSPPSSPTAKVATMAGNTEESTTSSPPRVDAVSMKATVDITGGGIINTGGDTTVQAEAPSEKGRLTINSLSVEVKMPIKNAMPETTCLSTSPPSSPTAKKTVAVMTAGNTERSMASSPLRVHAETRRATVDITGGGIIYPGGDTTVQAEAPSEKGRLTINSLSAEVKMPSGNAMPETTCPSISPPSSPTAKKTVAVMMAGNTERIMASSPPHVHAETRKATVDITGGGIINTGGDTTVQAEAPFEKGRLTINSLSAEVKMPSENAMPETTCPSTSPPSSPTAKKTVAVGTTGTEHMVHLDAPSGKGDVTISRTSVTMTEVGTMMSESTASSPSAPSLPTSGKGNRKTKSQKFKTSPSEQQIAAARARAEARSSKRKGKKIARGAALKALRAKPAQGGGGGGGATADQGGSSTTAASLALPATGQPSRSRFSALVGVETLSAVSSSAKSANLLLGLTTSGPLRNKMSEAFTTGVNSPNPSNAGESASDNSPSAGVKQNAFCWNPPEEMAKKTGLTNPGNRCAANAIVQFLRSDPVLRKAFMEATGNAAAAKLGVLFKVMEKAKAPCFIHPAVVTRLGIRSNEQEDAGDILLRLLGMLIVESEKPENVNTKPAMDGLQGEMMSLLDCSCRKPCQLKDRATDIFTLLTVPMEQLPSHNDGDLERGGGVERGDGDRAVHLDDLLKKMFDTELVPTCADDDCRKKNRGKSRPNGRTKEPVLTHCPDRLLLRLGRWTGNFFQRRKLDHLVTIPLVLDVGAYRAYKEVETVPEEETLYDLEAVIHHTSKEGQSGNLEGLAGHYIVFTRTGLNTWCCYNDDKISTVSTSAVLTENAFVLSYSKRG